MLVLAIDSAMNGCSACVCKTERIKGVPEVLAQRTFEEKRGQAEHLMTMIDSALKEAHIPYDALDIIGITNGPGAFTGMRVSMATAKAIALAAKKTIVGVSTMVAVLESFLYAQRKELKVREYYAVILETKRSDYYFQMFKPKNHKDLTEGMISVMPAKVANASEILSTMDKKDILLIGDAANRLMSECKQTWSNHEILSPEGAVIAKMALEKYLKNGVYESCKPVYLREAEIGKTKRSPRIIRSETSVDDCS